MKGEVVVVGSGIAGLTVAALLATQGRTVTLVEQKAVPGGSIRQFRRGGIGFEVGFHYTGCLGTGEFLDLLWRYCGVRAGLTVHPLADDSWDHYEFTDHHPPIRGFFSYDRLQEELSENFPAERQAIADYFRTIRGICQNVPFYQPQLPLTPFLREFRDRPDSLDRYLSSLTADPHLRAVLAAPAFLYGVPLVSASLQTHAFVAHSYYQGASAVVGGGQAIVNAFINRLQELGVNVLTGAELAMVEVDGSRVSGARLTDGRRLSCQDLVFTGHPATLLDRVPDGVFRKAYRSRLRELQNTVSMFAVFGRCEKPLSTFTGPTNYYLLPTEGRALPEFGEALEHGRPSMLTTTRNRLDDSLQGGGNGIILLRLGFWQEVAAFTDSSPHTRPNEYKALKERVAQEMIEVAATRWGQLTGKIETLAVGTPLSFRDELLSPEGCAYGARHGIEQMNPEVRTRLPGLYLSGQSTMMTGVVGASTSALTAAGEILDLEALWDKVRHG